MNMRLGFGVDSTVDGYVEHTSNGVLDFKQEIERMGNILDESFKRPLLEGIKQVDDQGYP